MSDCMRRSEESRCEESKWAMFKFNGDSNIFNRAKRKQEALKRERQQSLPPIYVHQKIYQHALMFPLWFAISDISNQFISASRQDNIVYKKYNVLDLVLEDFSISLYPIMQHLLLNFGTFIQRMSVGCNSGIDTILAPTKLVMFYDQTLMKIIAEAIKHQPRNLGGITVVDNVVGVNTCINEDLNRPILITSDKINHVKYLHKSAQDIQFNYITQGMLAQFTRQMGVCYSIYADTLAFLTIVSGRNKVVIRHRMSIEPYNNIQPYRGIQEVITHLSM